MGGLNPNQFREGLSGELVFLLGLFWDRAFFSGAGFLLCKWEMDTHERYYTCMFPLWLPGRKGIGNGRKLWPSQTAYIPDNSNLLCRDRPTSISDGQRQAAQQMACRPDSDDVPKGCRVTDSVTNGPSRGRNSRPSPCPKP